MDETSSESLSEETPLGFTARWLLPNQVNNLAFIGKNIIAVAHDIVISFLNLGDGTEIVYAANSEMDDEKPDGVDCIAGNKTKMFAIAEKTERGRIMIMNYPSFTIIRTLTAEGMNRYKGLVMMESDMVAGFSGFPHYNIVVWSWRTAQQLACIPTGVVRKGQIYIASRTNLLICQCWGEGLNVWEVAQCYKKSFTLKRTKEEKTGWEISEPRLVGVCWSIDGVLYAIDKLACLYSVETDNIGMVTLMEWSKEMVGTQEPCLCAFHNGLLILCPDGVLRSLKRMTDHWCEVFTYKMEEPVERMMANHTCDMAFMWTRNGLVYTITGESEAKINVKLVLYKPRNMKKIKFLAPNFTSFVTMDNNGLLSLFDVKAGQLITQKLIEGNDINFESSPVDSLLAVSAEVGPNYGIKLFQPSETTGEVTEVTNYCLTHQIVSLLNFSPTGRHLAVAAMSAGHVFIFKLSQDYALELVRYVEFGRGLADCCLMKVGEAMRCFNLVLFSDKYSIGERITCVNAENGKDNKFAGKMQGPYRRIYPLGDKNMMVALPHLSKQYHVLIMTGEKGISINVKIGSIINSEHRIRHFECFYLPTVFISYGAAGKLVLRESNINTDLITSLIVSHRYEGGILRAVIDPEMKTIITLNKSGAIIVFTAGTDIKAVPFAEPPDKEQLKPESNTLKVISSKAKNYLDVQEELKVAEEAVDCRAERAEVIKNFQVIQKKVVELLEENLVEPPLHQLSLSEFNLHYENKKERYKDAEKERELVRLNIEARIKAQDKVTAWIKKMCWDTMLTPRVKLFAIFSHYHVENYAVMPTQRTNWPELQQVQALRAEEMENDDYLFKPWIEIPPEETKEEIDKDMDEQIAEHEASSHSSNEGTVNPVMKASSTHINPYTFSGSLAHNYINIPDYIVPQIMLYSFLQMNWMSHVIKLNAQNMRLWFNKQFDELMSVKVREVGLIQERNSRLRFILSELNKLSDLRGSFHYLVIQITDPEWRQEEEPIKLTRVEVEECAIEPYISPSQVVIPPPEPKPKDDFKERALMDMMDGVLEKLWHEEIKKPIPMPQCMIDKDPEHFNEDDLRLVFDYEAKVRFRNEERDKYRKMLHAEYAKLSATLNEGIVKFNMKVKEMWITKLRVESVIGQETLNLMRVRRLNLDRVESGEYLEDMRRQISKHNKEAEILEKELISIQEQLSESQSAHDALAVKDKQLDKAFKNYFADLSQVIFDQCQKFYKKRPKWQQRASMTPTVLNELAAAIGSTAKSPMLHTDVMDYFKGVDNLDQISNMPAVMDEVQWATMVKLRRIRIENELRMRALVVDMAITEQAGETWAKTINARRKEILNLQSNMTEEREKVEYKARNKQLQLVLPAGQVEIPTTGRIEDFDDAVLMLRSDIEVINDAILKVGEMKLRMMRKQIEFRKGIIAKEWEHAQMRMRLRHFEEELYNYQRLKIPKELQLYLKNKELGYTDEMEYVRLEKELEATRMSFNRSLNNEITLVTDLEMRGKRVEDEAQRLDQLLSNLHLKVSVKRENVDQLAPLRMKRIQTLKMQTLVERSRLIRDVQSNHTNIMLLQTQLELMRLKTYPTLATIQRH